MAQLAAIPDGPEFEPTLSEQVENVLQEINVKERPSSVGKLYQWILKNPGPEAAATAAFAVKVATTAKESAERRLSLLYATHELFRQTSKNLDIDFDYEAWTEAVRALVPWTVRKQKSEVDKAKINKSVLKTWVTSGWFKKDFLEGLLPGRSIIKRASPPALSPAAAPAADSGGRRRRQSSGGGADGSGGRGAG
ncbi:unnamed protein product, partial [Ectocarpus sp. 12 AP-2014]